MVLIYRTGVVLVLILLMLQCDQVKAGNKEVGKGEKGKGRGYGCNEELLEEILAKLAGHSDQMTTAMEGACKIADVNSCVIEATQDLKDGLNDQLAAQKIDLINEMAACTDKMDSVISMKNSTYLEVTAQREELLNVQSELESLKSMVGRLEPLIKCPMSVSADLSDGQITATSYTKRGSYLYQPKCARLNHDYGEYCAAWMPMTMDSWLTVDLENPMKVAGFKIKGSRIVMWPTPHTASCYPKAVNFQYSVDKINWNYADDSEVKTTGLANIDTIATISFASGPVYARYARFQPKEYQGCTALQMDIIICV